MALDPIAAAEHVLFLQGNIPTNSLRLNKLIFLIDGWCLGFLGEPFVTEEAEAWEYGPVFRQVHEEFGKQHGKHPIRNRGRDHSAALGRNQANMARIVAGLHREWTNGELVERKNDWRLNESVLKKLHLTPLQILRMKPQTKVHHS